MQEIIAIDGSSIRPPGAAEVIKAVHAATQAEGVPYVLIGAAGRDIVLEHIYEIESPSATRDVDFAVMLDGWPAYDALRERLAQAHGFETATRAYRLRAPQGLLVDLIPFGGIEEPAGEISLPPQHTRVIVTLGFVEAHAHALLVEIDGVGPIQVASLTGLSVLKLLAWRDRGAARDAEDFALLARNYYDLLGEEVYLRHADLFDEDDFEMLTASARVLGRDAGVLTAGSTPLREALVALLEEQIDETRRISPLATAMGTRYVRGHDERIRCLRAYLRGFNEQGRLDPSAS